MKIADLPPTKQNAALGSGKIVGTNNLNPTQQRRNWEGAVCECHVTRVCECRRASEVLSTSSFGFGNYSTTQLHNIFIAMYIFGPGLSKNLLYIEIT